MSLNPESWNIPKRSDFKEIIELLEQLSWWDKPIEEIKVSYNTGYRRNENITPQIYQQEISYAIHINRKRTVDR